MKESFGRKMSHQKYFQSYTASQRLSSKLKSCDWQPVFFRGWQNLAYLLENSSNASSLSSVATATFTLGSLWPCQHLYSSLPSFNTILIQVSRTEMGTWPHTHSKLLPASVLNLVLPNSKLLELLSFGMKSCHL